MSERVLGDYYPIGSGDNVIDQRDATALFTTMSQMRECNTINPVPNDADIKAGDVLMFGKLHYLDAYAVSRVYGMSSTTNDRIYPQAQPANWTSDAVYKNYYFINESGTQIPLSEYEHAPDWVTDKYYFYGSYYTSKYAGNNIRPLLSTLP